MKKGFASNGVFVAASERLSVEGQQDGQAAWVTTSNHPQQRRLDLLILDRGNCGDSGRRNDPLKCTTQRDFGDKDDKPQKTIKNQHTERIESVRSLQLPVG
jgi:hypothetical protein